MDKRLWVIFLPVLAILLLTSFGCKGKVEKATEALSGEIPEQLLPTEEQLVKSGLPQSETVVTPSSLAAPQTATGLVLITVPSEQQSREKEIQKALQSAGFYFGKIDGIVGPQTKKAIEEFQKTKGLKVDGKVGPKTWAELEKYLRQQPQQ